MKSGFTAVALTLLGSIHICGTAGATEPQPGGILNFAISNGEPSTFDCHAAGNSAAFHRLLPHYSSLLRFDTTNYPNIVGDVAESWTVSDDGLTYAFTLRPGVKFHDGSTLTANDVRVTFDRIRHPPTGVVSTRAQLFKDVTTIDTPDDRHITFHLSQPNAAMLSYMAMPWNCIYSAAKLASDPAYPTRVVMGTGPYVFKEYVAGSVWRGERFPDYFIKGRPYLDGFAAYSLAGPAVANALSAGQVAVDFRGLNPPDFERVRAARGDAIRSFRVDQSAMLMVTFNTTRPPFDDWRVRRALSLAIDRWAGSEALQKIVYYSQVGGYLRFGTPFARTEAELTKLPGFSHDIEASRKEARRLLAEAGQSNLKLTFLNNGSYVPIGVFLVDQWRQIGVQVIHDPADIQRLLAARSAGNYDVLLDSNDNIDEPSLQFAQYYSFDKNPNNYSRAIDRHFDELYDQQGRTLDVQKRRQLVQSMEAYLADRSYSVPLFWAQRLITLDRRVNGYVVPPQQYLGQDLADIWLSKE
jgi:peptide/nickel transport system substrate-binding protein